MATTLAEKLKHLRVQHGDMTAVALAKIAGVSKQTMSLWLKGDRRPSIDEGLRMARYFRVPLDWLADELADYPPPGGPGKVVSVIDVPRAGSLESDRNNLPARQGVGRPPKRTGKG